MLLLIKRIFKRRIHTEIRWDKSLWRKIEISLIKAQIPKNKYIDVNTLEAKIKQEVKPRRFVDIKNYQLQLTKGTNYPPPLYISGKCINYLGGKVDDNLLFILDGSRRLTAHILNKHDPKILLIDLKMNNFSE